MWNRQELKANGKFNMKKNYWNSVLVAFIYSLFFGASGASISNKVNSEEGAIDLSDPEMVGRMLIILGAVGVTMAIVFIVKVFLLNPLNVGCNRFFVQNQNKDEKAAVNELGYAFKSNYGESVVAMFLTTLLIGLGFCLFLIPGIILTYSYRMVPYILSHEPHVGVVETLKRSREMMKGNKWNAFVFDLSFIGWHILSLFTCCILELFFVAPYFHNANAQLYIAIRDEFDRKVGQSPASDPQ